MNIKNYFSKCLLLSIILTWMFSFGVNAQQTFTMNMEASLVIGQPNFVSTTDLYSQSTTYGPVYSAISADGKLAVALQTGGGVYLWNSLPTTNGQSADVVVGNADFDSIKYECTQSLTSEINGVAFSPDGQKLIISDSGNNRVLIWNTIPTENGQPADLVLGQSDFVTNVAGEGASKMSYPTGVIVSPNGKLFVSDAANNRILVWNSIPNETNTLPDLVIGQPDFDTVTSGSELNKLYEPWGVWVSPDGKLLIGDSLNDRVLVFNTIPTTNGASADVVIGDGSGVTSASTLIDPVGATVSPDGKLFIGEYGNNRVLIYNNIPTENGAAADIVLGQPDFISANAFWPDGISNASNMETPYNVSTDLNGRLYVTGRDMNRVMVFGTQPTDEVDLGIAISALTESVCNGSQVGFSIIVTNNSSVNATGIIATAALPALFNYEGHIAGAGTYNPASGYWVIDNLAAGESVELQILGTVAGLDPITLSVYASILQLNQLDLNYTNNATSVGVEVFGGVPPSGGVLTGPTESYYGQTVEYTLDEVIDATDYNWVILGAESVSGTGNSRQITFGTQPVQIFVVPVNATCSGSVFMRNVTLTHGYLAEWISVDTGISDWCPGETREVVIEVKNAGAFSWLPTPDFSVAYWWNGQSAADELRLPILEIVNPEEVLTITTMITAPLTPGSINLNFDIEKVGSCLFASNTGECGVSNQEFVSPAIDVQEEINIAVLADGDHLTASNTEADGYQWIRVDQADALIPTAETFEYMVTETGVYAVIITEGNCSARSEDISVIFSGLQDANSNAGISVYPNPSKGIVSIDLGRDVVDATLRITDVNGNKVFENTNFSGRTTNVDITHTSSGVYVLELLVNNDVEKVKIIKK